MLETKRCGSCARWDKVRSYLDSIYCYSRSPWTVLAVFFYTYVLMGFISRLFGKLVRMMKVFRIIDMYLQRDIFLQVYT